MLVHQNTLTSESTKLAPPLSSSFFLARVVDTDPITFSVRVAPYSQTEKGLQDGLPLASQLTHMLGMKEACLPPIGANVLCLKARSTYCYILGVVPEYDHGFHGVGFPLRSVLGGGDGNDDTANIQKYDKAEKLIHNSNRPTDILDGEFVRSNEFGVLLGLFQNFATLKASELAQIQTFVLDDLVRIVSHNFQHITSMGEVNISHDGRGLNLEYSLTHEPGEALGKPQVTSSTQANLVESTGQVTASDVDSFYKLSDNDRLKAIERLKIFVGKLGDLVRVMLVRPDESETRKLDGEIPNNPDTGLFDFHLGVDGGVMLRTVKGLFIEKTNWIRVPHRVRTPEDPAGDETDQLDYDNKPAFNFDKSYSYKEQPFLFFLQMRDYMAYMHETYGLKNFKKHEKDFYINDVQQKEKQLSEITRVDPLSETEYEKRTSGFYMMPNGGIMMRDAWGSALVLEGGNIMIQPAKDLIFQPMRNLIAKVGQFTSIASRKDIDFSSTEGGARIKTDKAQHIFSKAGGIVIQTDSKGGPDYAPEDQAVETTCGIVMKSNGGIYSKAQNYYIRSTGSYAVFARDLALEGEGSTTILSNDEMRLFSHTALYVASKGTAAFVSTQNQALIFGDKATFIGIENQEVAVTPIGAATGILPREGKNSITDFMSALQKLDDFDVKSFTFNFREDESWDNLQFRFLDSTKYFLSLVEDVIPQTLVQSEQETFGILHELETWTETAMTGTYPYPGAGNAQCLVGAEIKNLELNNNELYNKVDAEKEGTLNKVKNIFSEYKILG